MKKINIPRTIWITALFLVLIVILIAVMDYKIHYQYKIKNKIYFYECSGNLCVTEVKSDDYLLYSEYECGYEDCPIFKSTLEDTYAILSNKDNNILFNYRNGNIISAEYENYQQLNNNYLIVTKAGYQGIINLKNEIIIPLNYQQLGYIKDGYLTGYGINYIIAKKDNKYGIISIKDGTIIEDFSHEETNIENLLTILNDKEKLLQSN